MKKQLNSTGKISQDFNNIDYSQADPDGLGEEEHPARRPSQTGSSFMSMFNDIEWKNDERLHLERRERSRITQRNSY